MNTTDNNEKHAPNYRIYDRTGGGVTEDISAVSLEDAIRQGKEWIEAGDWSGKDEDDEGAYVTITLPCEVAEIAYDADGCDITDEGEMHDCSGTHADEEPGCAASSDGEHDWRSPADLVGGLRENPGVWSTGGTGMAYTTVCACCGVYRDEVDPGWQRNRDEPLTRVTFRDADEASEAWILDPVA